MPKGQQRGNREAKKPKKDRTVAIVTTGGLASARATAPHEPMTGTAASTRNKRK